VSAERPPRDRVPVLTEVIEVRASAPALASAGAVADIATAVTTDGSARGATPGTVPPDPTVEPGRARPVHAHAADALGPQARLIAEAILQHIELQLEARLREALAPALARAADTLIREARADVAAVVREVVDEAVDRELGSPGRDWHESA